MPTFFSVMVGYCTKGIKYIEYVKKSHDGNFSLFILCLIYYSA